MSLPEPFSRRFADWHREVEKTFAELIDARWGRSGAPPSWQPSVDLIELDEAYVLLADLPGVSAEDVEIRVEHGELVLCGSRWNTAFVREGRGLIVERSFGRFCRHFPLDEPVDPDRMETGYENGIYWARLPKTTKGKE